MQSLLKQGVLRPSNLPKLFQCVWFRSQEAQTQAAARGSAIDTIYRQITVGLRDFPNGTAAEIAAADWAANQTRQIAGNHRVLAKKTDCSVTIPGFPAPGEVDALCPSLFCSFDLKSGQYYDYRWQMAAYAWGLMEKYFSETWTTWLLFCDLRRLYHYTFPYAEAKRLVLEVQAKYAAAGAPQANPYCPWCANAASCPALIKRADHALALAEKPAFDFQALLANPDKLGRFLAACRALTPLEKQASDRLKQYLQQKVDVPGWHLVTHGPGKYVEAAAVLPLAEKLGIAPVLAEYGHLSFAKYEKLRQFAQLPADLTVVQQGAGTVYLHQSPNHQENIPS